MKAIQKTKSKKLLSERVTAMEGDPRGALATWGRRMAGRTRSIFIVLRHGILSLYSYIRKFVPWRSRTYIQNLRHVRIAGVTSSFLFGLLALAIIIPLYNVTGTEDTEAATGTAIDSSITFTSTRNTATVDLTPTSTSGTFASSTSGTTDAAFSITTTNSQGYELKIKSTSGTVLKPTTTTSDSDGLSTISTSGITSSSFTNNTWGYLPSYYNSTSNTTKYYPATTSDVTLRKTTSANNTAHNYTIGLGAKADLTKTSGTYTLGGNKGSLVLTYVANPTTYSITYNKNTTDTVTNMPYSSSNNVQSGSVSATSVTLSNLVPVRNGFNFKGWCSKQVSDDATCTGTTYNNDGAGTNLTYGIDRTSANNATLYAMWSKATVNVTVNFAGSGVTGVTFANTTYGNVTVSTSGNTAALKYGVQYDITGTYSSGYEFSSWSATAGALGSTTTASTTYSTTTTATLTLTGKSSIVYTDFCTKNGIPDSQCLQKMSFSNCPTTATSFTDMRDGNTYKIQKLADGSCWLLDNLAIDLASAQTMVNLTADTTNATDTELGYLKNGGGTTSDQYATAGVANWTSGNSYSAPLYNVADKDTTVTSYGSGSGKVGGYYNYCAASAGTYCYGNGTSYGTSSGNATADICPKGWQMPSTASSNNVAGSYYYLYNTAYSADASNFRIALSTPLSGGFDDGSAYNRGSIGYFWSSTRTYNYSMYNLYVDSSRVSPSNSSGRNVGYSVRCVMTPPTLYETIASMSKGKQTNDTNATTGIQAAITAPTSTDRSQDTSNSGVYEYDASLFGASSDASNDYPIYYYRGILEPSADQGLYGSNGKATTYPNYVRLGNNTCWRILRTTGSGGVKLIYNGTYGATTSGSCANAQTKAQVITSRFNHSSASNGYTSLNYYNIHAIGYTYNNSVTGSTSSTAASTVFGSNSNYSVNSSSSIMKQYLEKTWYTTNMTNYTSKLEPSAGYCNDRSLYASGSYASANVLAETTTVIPYGTSSMTQYYFGPYTRNGNSAQKPSLTCPRNVVDLYTTSSASNGNKQLTYPVALATADEMSFAGSGNSTASNGSSYNAKSFAGSGSDFWLLSPYNRGSIGLAVGYSLYSGGYLNFIGVGYVVGVRPVISLTSGTTPASGSGTATDPWVVQ